MLSALVVILASPPASRGSTFVMMSESELAARSVAAVRGWVTAIESAEDPESGGVNTYVHLLPERVVFGSVPDGELMLREAGGRVGGRSEWIFGSFIRPVSRAQGTGVHGGGATGTSGFIAVR